MPLGERKREREVFAMRLPRGCRFDPRESELIEYLQDKVERRPDACQGVIKNNIDVYGCSHEQLFGDLILGDDGRLFCFTPIKHRAGNCRDRSTPDGYWKSTKKRTVIHDSEGRSVGFVQYLCYHHGRKRTKWLMKEYTLFDDLPKMALCAIYSAQNKCKGRIQGNEWRMKSNCLDNSPSFNQLSKWNNPSNLQEAIYSESEDTRLPLLSNDPSFLGNATKDECHQYHDLVAAKTDDNHNKVLFMAQKLFATEVAQKFNEPEERVCPGKGEGGFNFQSSQGTPSPTSTSVAYLRWGEGCLGSNSVVSDWPLGLDLDFLGFDDPSQESPSIHSVAPI